MQSLDCGKMCSRLGKPEQLWHKHTNSGAGSGTDRTGFTALEERTC